MDMERLAEIFEAVKVMPLRPSDLLVFRSNAKLGMDELASVYEDLEAQTGHSRILILEGGADLAVLRREGEPAPPAREEPAGPVHRPLVASKPKAPGAL